MGNTLADTLNEYAQQANQAQQVTPPGKPIGASPPPGPIVAPIQPKPSKSPGFLEAGMHLLADSMPNFLTGRAPPTEADYSEDADTLKGLGAGVLRAPGQLVGGTIDTLADVGKFVGDNIHNQYIRKAVLAGSGLGGVLEGAQAARTSVNGASLADKLSMRQSLWAVGNSNVNQFTAEASGAALPMVGAEGLAANTLRAAIGGELAINPTKGQDPLESRGGNAAVAAGATLGLGLLGKVVGAGADLLKKPTKIITATPDEAAADALDRTFAQARTTEARYKAADPTTAAEPTEQEVATPSRVNDRQSATPAKQGGSGNAPPARTPDADASEGAAGAVHPVGASANAALEQSGAAERLPEDGTHQLNPNGTLKVDPVTKATLDAQGMGRAFSATDEGLEPQQIFKEEAPDGSSRVVGKIGDTDLKGFLSDVEHFRKNPDQVYQSSTHPTGQWSLPKLGSIDDVGAFARALSDRIPAPGSRTNAEALAAATSKATGMDPGDISRFVGDIASDSSKVREATLAVRVLHAKAMQELSDLPTAGYADKDAADPLVQAAIGRIHNAMTLHTQANILKSEAGAALQLHGVDLNDPSAQALNLKPGDEIPPKVIPDRDAYVENFGKVPDEQLPAKDTTEGPGLPRTPKELDDWMRQYKVAQSMDDPQVLNKFLNDQPISLRKWMYLRNSNVNAFTASIVSAPRTLIRDAWGPGIISGFNTVGRSLGNGLQALNPLLSDADRSAAWAASWSAPRAYARTMLDSMEALRQAGATVQRQFAQKVDAAGNPIGDKFGDLTGSNLGTSHSLLGGHNPIDVNVQGIPKAIIDLATQTDPGVTGAVPYYLGNLINKWPQVIQALHGGVNDFSQRLAYLGEVRSSAYQEAATMDPANRDAYGYAGVKANGLAENYGAGEVGLKGGDFDKYVRDRLSDSIDPVTGAANDQDALSAAQRTTLTRRPTPTDPYALRKAQQVRSDVIKEFPEARYILPIFTVPANAMGETLRRIPVLNLIGVETRDELLGARGVVAQGDAYGRMLTGGAALLAGWGLARNGVLTGAGPEEPNARRVWMQTHQPYSVHVGDQWYSYSKSDIVGPMLGIMAGSFDQTVNRSQDQGPGAHAWAAAMGLAGYFKDQASLKGLSDLMNIGGNPQESASTANRLLGGIASGYVPNFVEQLGREQTDDENRIKRNPWDYIKDRLPGQSQTLDPSRNTLGEPTHKPWSVGFNSFPISMANANTYAKDPVMDEMARLYQNTGYAPGVLATGAGPNTHLDYRDVKAEDGYSVYEHMVRALPEVRNDEGQSLREALQENITSPDYTQAIDGKAANSLDQFGDKELTRGGILQKTFDDFHKLAKQKAAQDSPMTAAYMATASAKSHASAVLASYPVSELVKPGGQSLMKSLGIDIDQFTQTAKGNP